MKIGILAYRQYPYISANTSIAYTIGQYIKENTEHQVVYIGRLQDETQRAVSEYEGIPVCFFNNKPLKYYSRFTNYTRKMFGDGTCYSREATRLKKIVAEEKIDALICIIAPSDNLYIVNKAKLDIPVVLYQLDPFFSVNDIVNEKLKKSLVHIIAKDNIIHFFTTDLLYKEYYHYDEFKPFLDKISVLQFPKLKYHYTDRTLDFNKKTKMLYAGSLYSGIRSPQILIELSKGLPEHTEIVFCGGCDNPSDIKKLKDNGIICKGYLSQTELEKEYNEADVLINIGNLVKNQLGSKLIDYISTGKPIVNIYQIEMCPTLSVLEKYNLCISLCSGDLNGNSAKTKLHDFLSGIKGQIIPFDEIQKTYVEYTPEYVCNSILDIL